MVRVIYCWLLRLHPARFRDRFEQEMLGIFDEASGTRGGLWLIRDAVLSLFRQWILRPKHRRPAAGTHVLHSSSNGIPLFITIENVPPHPTALLLGGLLSLGLFAAIVTSASHGSRAPIVGGALLSTSGSRSSVERTPVGNKVLVIDADSETPQHRSSDAAFGSEFVVWVRNTFWGSNEVDAKLGATPAGTQFRDWVYVYNTGDASAIRGFCFANIAAGPDVPSTEQRVRTWMEQFERLGSLIPRRIEQWGPNLIIARGQTTRGATWHVVLQVTRDEPHVITQINMQTSNK